jgi:hypothetical protein
MDLPEVFWRKSSRSQGGGQNCVEVAVFGGAVVVRDSKDKDGAMHVLRSPGWHAFLGHIKSGHYDGSR